MLSPGLVGALALAYLGALFGVATWADRRARAGRSVVANPAVYALSLAVYCTAWTFYGSVGRAAGGGLEFLTVYLGPTLLALLGPTLVRKVVRVSRAHRITSLADFLGARYGKSALVSGVAAAIAVVGVVPYLALQLKAVAASYTVLTGGASGAAHGDPGPLGDPALWATLALALFAVLFGTRSLDVTERHEGLVAAVAVESAVKLLAFLAVGAFVVFGLYAGPADLFARAQAAGLTEAAGGVGGADWFGMLLVSFFAVLLLPRQFHVAVVENTDDRHLETAAWAFPLYLLAINLFVWPIALAGRLRLPAGVDADTFVLTLPLAEGHPWLAAVVFLGGLSAAAGMAVVSAVALSTMASNHLVMPALLRWRRLRLGDRPRLAGLVLGVRRATIGALMLAAYGYYGLVGEAYGLVSIGLVSFAAVAQFAPALLGGLYWTEGSRGGALAGMVGGFAVWGYTLALPTLVDAGVLAESFRAEGPWGLGALRPQALLGLDGLSPLTHAVFWSLLVNVGLYLGVSVWGRRGVVERAQAVQFVRGGGPSATGAGRAVWRGRARVADLETLLARFLGARRAAAALAPWRESHPGEAEADAEAVGRAEAALAGVIGTASARVVVGAVVEEEPIGLAEVVDLLDEAQQTIAYSRALERKSAQLEEQQRLLAAAGDELRAANRRLRELDELKDEFVSTVTHELRTPLTSIRAFAEILLAQPDLPPDQRQEFLDIVVAEGERLSRLVDGVLRLQRPAPAGEARARFDLRGALADAARVAGQGLPDPPSQLTLDVPPDPVWVEGDRDGVVQLALNLLGNAVKVCTGPDPRIHVEVEPGAEVVAVRVRDNGPGIHPDDHAVVFESFRQARPRDGRRPAGSGLGLAIARRIAEDHGGTLGLESAVGEGATFTFTLPRARGPAPAGGDGQAAAPPA